MNPFRKKKKSKFPGLTLEQEKEQEEKSQAKADELNKSSFVKEWEEMAKVFPAGTEVEFLGVKLFINRIVPLLHYVECELYCFSLIHYVNTQSGECSCDYVDGEGIFRKKSLTIEQLRSILEKRNSWP